MKLIALFIIASLALLSQSRTHLMAVPPSDTAALATAASGVKAVRDQIEKLQATPREAEDHLCAIEKSTRKKMGEPEGHCSYGLETWYGSGTVGTTTIIGASITPQSEFSDDYKYLLRREK